MRAGEEYSADLQVLCSVLLHVFNSDCQIFCTHGGIPRPCHGGGMLSAIRELPVVLSDPETQCELAWELMWSDPIRYVCNLCTLPTVATHAMYVPRYMHTYRDVYNDHQGH